MLPVVRLVASPSAVGPLHASGGELAAVSNCHGRKGMQACMHAGGQDDRRAAKQAAQRSSHPVGAHPAAGVTKLRVLEGGVLVPSGLRPTTTTVYCRRAGTGEQRLQAGREKHLGAGHAMESGRCWLLPAITCMFLLVHRATPVRQAAGYQRRRSQLIYLGGGGEAGERSLWLGAGHSHGLAAVQGRGREGILQAPGYAVTRG